MLTLKYNSNNGYLNILNFESVINQELKYKSLGNIGEEKVILKQSDRITRLYLVYIKRNY
jgi:hypothetical protein